MNAAANSGCVRESEEEAWEAAQPALSSVLHVQEQLSSDRRLTDIIGVSVRVWVKEATSKWSVLPLNCQTSSAH